MSAGPASRSSSDTVTMRGAGTLALMLLAAPAAAQQAATRPQQLPAWAQMPRMQLERQFAGPLQDTIIQRWRDPADGTVCYIYLPITAPHTPPTQSGYVQYGATTIGSISCTAPPPTNSVQAKAAPPAPPAKAAPRPAPPKPLTPAQPAAPVQE
jgi:hypothetical protein